PETPAVVAVGRTGEFQFFPPVPAMNAEARALRARGAEVVIVLAHVGAIAVAPDGTPRGAIVEMARGARGVDVLIGDHTDMTVNTVINGVLVVENRSKGVEYAVVTVDYDRRARAVVGKAAVQKRPWTDAVRPDPTVQALIEEYHARSRPLFDVTVGAAAVRLDRSRQEKSRLGNLETDALRATYGTDFAFDVSGALRDDVPSTYQPADRRLRRPSAGYAAGPPWDVVEGDFHAVFPFNNVAVTFRVSGRTLWAALENSVSQGAWVGGRFQNGVGRFLQVSGLRYTFDPRRPPRRGRDANGRRFHRAGRHRVHRGDERLRLQRGRWLRDAGERDGRDARVDRRDDQPRGPRPRTRDRHRRRPHHGRAVMWRVAQLPFSRRSMSARVAGDAQSWGPTPRASSRP